MPLKKWIFNLLSCNYFFGVSLPTIISYVNDRFPYFGKELYVIWFMIGQTSCDSLSDLAEMK